MSKRPFYVFGIFAAVCLLVLPIFALGKEGEQQAALVQVDPQDQEGRDLFANNCGSCHTLAAAGTDGVVGPNLDDLIAPTGVNDASAFEGGYAIALNAVSCGIDGRMPKEILIGEEAKQVSAFVAAYAAQLDKGPVVDTSSIELDDFSGTCG